MPSPLPFPFPSTAVSLGRPRLLLPFSRHLRRTRPIARALPVSFAFHPPSQLSPLFSLFAPSSVVLSVGGLANLGNPGSLPVSGSSTRRTVGTASRTSRSLVRTSILPSPLFPPGSERRSSSTRFRARPGGEPNRRVDASHRYAGSGTGKREAAAGEPLPCHLPFPFLSPPRLFRWGGLVSSSPSPVTCAALAPSRVLSQSLSLST